MLLVEGSDCVGKTNLCERLRAIIGPGCRYEHNSRPPDDRDRYRWYRDQVVQGPVVMDRFHLGEWVYPQVRHERPIDAETVRLIEAHLRLVGAYVVVVVETSRERLYQRYWDRGPEEMYPFDLVWEANTLFAHLPPQFDVDRRVFLSQDQPFVTDAEAESIAAAYLRRLDRVRQA